MPQLGLSNQLTQENNQPAFIFVDQYHMTFDGGDDKLQLPTIDTSGDHTIMAIFKIDSTSGVRAICNITSSATDGFALVSPDGESTVNVSKRSGTTSGYTKKTSSLSTGKWHMLVAVKDASNGIENLYVNGVDDTNDGTSHGVYTSATGSQIAARNNTDFWNGGISEIMLWDRKLDLGEVQRLYRGSRDVRNTSLQHWWRFGDSPEDSIHLIQDYPNDIRVDSSPIVMTSTNTVNGWTAYNDGETPSGNTFTTSGDGSGGVWKELLSGTKGDLYRLILATSGTEDSITAYIGSNGSSRIAINDGVSGVWGDAHFKNYNSVSGRVGYFRILAGKTSLEFGLADADQSGTISVIELVKITPGTHAVIDNMDDTAIVSGEINLE